MLSQEQGIKEIFENPKSVFSLLSPPEKEDLIKQSSVTLFRKNEFIYKEGDIPSAFMFLIDGKVKIFKEGVGGREQIIRMTKPMGYVGYRALIAEEIHNASAVTLEDSNVLVVNTDHFFNKLLRNPDFAFRLIQKLARELGFSNSRTVTLTQKHIRGRLAESLLRITSYNVCYTKLLRF